MNNSNNFDFKNRGKSNEKNKERKKEKEKSEQVFATRKNQEEVRICADKFFPPVSQVESGIAAEMYLDQNSSFLRLLFRAFVVGDELLLPPVHFKKKKKKGERIRFSIPCHANRGREMSCIHKRSQVFQFFPSYHTVSAATLPRRICRGERTVRVIGLFSRSISSTTRMEGT